VRKRRGYAKDLWLLRGAAIMFDEMYASIADRSTRRLLNRLVKVDVLVIDEMGYPNLRPEHTVKIDGPSLRDGDG
jgi:hypothetical protein